MNHKDLVEHAKFWLQTNKKCNPVFTEKGCGSFSEMPDVLGFTAQKTIVMECKTSRSDLMADKKKPFRESGGLGNFRYYFMPKELYEQCKDYDFNGWGIVTILKEKGIKVRQVRGLDSMEFKSNLEHERNFLRSRILEIQRFGS